MLGRDGVAGIVPFHQSVLYEPFGFLCSLVIGIG